MASSLILVNGLPGSGKSTLSRRLGQAMQLPVISKDELKEFLADAAGGKVAGGRLGRIASETMWQLAAAIQGTAIVESWWYRPRDLEHARRGIALSGTPGVVELWCDVDPATARERFNNRARHEVHTMDPATAEATWADWAEKGAPLGLGPTLTVGTATPVDLDALQDGLSAALETLQTAT